MQVTKGARIFIIGGLASCAIAMTLGTWPSTARAQATLDMSRIDRLAISQPDQASLDQALQAVANAIANGDQNAIIGAETQLANAVRAAVTDYPVLAAQIAGAATAIEPMAALTIAQAAAAAYPPGAGAIGVAVYKNLPPPLQDNVNKTAIADAIGAVASPGASALVMAALNGTNYASQVYSHLPPVPPPPPLPISSR